LETRQRPDLANGLKSRRSWCIRRHNGTFDSGDGTSSGSVASRPTSVRCRPPSSRRRPRSRTGPRTPSCDKDCGFTPRLQNVFNIPERRRRPPLTTADRHEGSHGPPVVLPNQSRPSTADTTADSTTPTISTTTHLRPRRRHLRPARARPRVTCAATFFSDFPPALVSVPTIIDNNSSASTLYHTLMGVLNSPPPLLRQRRPRHEGSTARLTFSNQFRPSHGRLRVSTDAYYLRNDRQRSTSATASSGSGTSRPPPRSRPIAGHAGHPHRSWTIPRQGRRFTDYIHH